MSRSATLAIKIVGDASSGIRALDDAEGKAGRFSSGMAKAAAGAVAVVGAVGAIGVAAFNAASDLEQSTGAINSVFGDWAVDIEQAAQSAADSVGLSTSAYEQLAAVLGSQLKGTGMNIGDVTDKTQDLVAMGADLAATFGGETADAVAALSSVLKGETDPIERYGVSIKQSDINARLAAEGSDKLTGSALKQATAAAALAIVTEQTASAAGAFGRESDTAAGKQARLSAWWENAQATLGAGLLPVFVAVTGFISDKVAPVIDRLIGQGGPLSGMFTAVGAFITTQVVPALSALWNELGPKLVPIFETVGGIITNFVMPAFMAVWGVINDYVVPIIGTVLSPVLDGIQTVFASVSDALGDNGDRFSGLLDKVRPLLEFLRDTVAPFIGGALKSGFEVLADVIGTVIDGIAWVLDKAATVGGFIGDVGSWMFGSSAAPVYGAAPAVFGAARTASPLRAASMGTLAGGGPSPAAAGQGSPVVVQVTFAGAVVGLDLESVADELQAILDRRARRTGALPAFGGAR